MCNGKQDRKGTFTWGNKDKYTGKWKNDKKNGHGRMTYTDGISYTGQWKNGMKHGEGKCVYSTSTGTECENSYDGNWDTDKRHGYGIRKYVDGDTYTGHYKNHLKHGKGTYIFASGDVIDATWKKDVCISGTYKYVEDKNTYKGTFIIKNAFSVLVFIINLHLQKI